MSKRDAPIYIDIDGTLTDAPDTPNGKVLVRRMNKVRQMVRDGFTVVLWSMRGTEYVKKFARQNALNNINVVCLGKPKFCVDDKPTISKAGLDVRSPEWLDE